MYRTVEGMMAARKIIIVTLKERINFFEINILLLKELMKQWMTARSPVKINTVTFKEWMTATLSVTKTDILLQRKDSCNY